MAEQLYQLQTLDRVCNHATTSETATSGASDRCHPTNVKCAFHQSQEAAVAVIVRSDHLVTLLAEELGKTIQKKSIQWFIDSGKTITCICWIQECLWALLGTADATLYILPVLPLIDSSWSQSRFSHTPEYPTADICSILLKKQKYTKPTSIACWRSKFLNGHIGVVGTEEGEVVFVDLLSRQELMRVKIGDSVMNLEVVNHGKFLTYLLISTATNNQFSLLLEQTCSEAASLSNSMEVEASNLEFTLVKSSDTIISILDSEVNDPAVFRLTRFNQFMRTVQLSVHAVKGNTVIAAHCLSSNVVKVYDSSLDSWLALFVYNIPISTDRILLTDNFMFTLTKACKVQSSSVTILSTKFSEISGKDHFSEAKLQTLFLPNGEEIVGIYRQHFLKKNSLSNVEDGSGRSANKGDDFTGLVDGCIIVGSTGLYQIKPRVNFDDVCLNLIAEGQTRKADILGMTLDLNMSSLLLRAAERKLRQKQLQEAARLYGLSRCSSMVWAYCLAKYGYVQETLAVIEGILNKQGEEGHANCCKLALVAIKCLILLYHNSGNRRDLYSMLSTFLSDNLDYDEVEAIQLLGSHSLFELMLNVALTRGHLETAMETLFENWPNPPGSRLLAKLTSPEFLDAFVTAKNALFMEKLPKRETINVLMLRRDLVLRHASFLGQHIHLFSIHQLTHLALLIDPCKPDMRDIFKTHRERSDSTSSITSIDSFYGSESVKATKPAAVVQFFISVLIELQSRRSQKDYDATKEPALTQVGKMYIHSDPNLIRHSSMNSGVRRNLLSCGRHHAGLISSGELYTWGKATSGRLGHGSIIPVDGSSLPLRVETLHMHQHQVVNISCGNEHTFALTSMGQVYSWGNSRFGQLGMGDRKTRTHPSLVEKLQLSGCVEVVCGQYHCLARTQQNQVLSWGWGVHGQLGHDSIEDELLPRVISSLVGVSIVQIGAGACHSGVLSADGKVMMFGSGAFGQLGSEGVSKISRPLALSHFDDQPVKLLSCGYYHNLALTASQPEQLYIWGKSPAEIRTQHQMTRKLKKAKREMEESAILRSHMTPVSVSLRNVSSPVKKMVCSYTHSLLLTESGKIYTWGRNDMDQLGNPSSNKKYEDTPSVIQAGKSFAEIGAGCDFSAAIDHYGVVFTWGSAEAQQLGHTLSNQSLLQSTVVCVSSPRKVSNIPLIMIPVQLQQPPLFTERDNKEQFPSHRGVTENLGDDTSELAVSDDHQLLYSETSLLSVLEHMRGYYHPSDVLKECRDRELWSLASKIYSFMDDYANAFCCKLRAQKQENPNPSLDDSITFISSYLKGVSQQFPVEKLHNYQRSLQNILMEIFVFWDKEGYNPTDLEVTLLAHLGLLAYPLSILLFSSLESRATTDQSDEAPLMAKFQSAFSTKFCLEVTAAASSFIQTGKFTVLGDLKVTNSVNELPVEEGTRASIEPLQSSKAELIPDLIRRNGIFGEEGLEIDPDAFTESESVIFTCNHSFSRSELLEEVAGIEQKLLSHSETLHMTCAITKGLFQDDMQLMPSACPNCTLNSLLPLVTY